MRGHLGRDSNIAEAASSRFLSSCAVHDSNIMQAVGFIQQLHNSLTSLEQLYSGDMSSILASWGSKGISAIFSPDWRERKAINVTDVSDIPYLKQVRISIAVQRKNDSKQSDTDPHPSPNPSPSFYPNAVPTPDPNAVPTPNPNTDPTPYPTPDPSSSALTEWSEHSVVVQRTKVIQLLQSPSVEQIGYITSIVSNAR